MAPSVQLEQMARPLLHLFSEITENTSPLSLQSRTATSEIVTTAKGTRPLPAKITRAPIDVDLTWLFQHISSEDINCNFTSIILIPSAIRHGEMRILMWR